MALALGSLVLAGMSAAASPANAQFLRVFSPSEGWRETPSIASGPSITTGSTFQQLAVRPEGDSQLCYQVLVNGSWLPEACDGTVVGQIGSPIQAVKFRRPHLTEQDASVCYTAQANGGWGIGVCDGGVSNQFGPVTGISLRPAATKKTWRHKRSVWSLTAAERSELAGLLRACITDGIVDAHDHVNHGSGADLLTMHRHLIEHELEHCIRHQPNGTSYVPIPYWDPATPIPAELQEVKPTDWGEPRLALAQMEPGRFYTAGKPAAAVEADICQIKSAADYADRVRGWHNRVHGAVGGAMNFSSISAAALIFWPWHAYVDNLYETWLRCSAPPPSPPSQPTGPTCFVSCAGMRNWLQQHCSFMGATLTQFQCSDTSIGGPGGGGGSCVNAQGKTVGGWGAFVQAGNSQCH